MIHFTLAKDYVFKIDGSFRSFGSEDEEYGLFAQAICLNTFLPILLLPLPSPSPDLS